MNTTEIIKATYATKGIPKGAEVQVIPTDPIVMPNLAKHQIASINVIGPRGACWHGYVRHDGSIGRFLKV